MDEREVLYQKIEERIGGELGCEIVSAIKYLYKRFDRRMLKWAAGLYDYEIGGFYYSNSARDTDGYLPDIESTWDFIVLPYSLGGMKKFADNLESAIAKGYPAWFKERVVNYFLSLQEPDGLYYHPQWEHDKHTISRLGRDRGSANTILRAFGSSPKYELARVGSGSDGELVPERYRSRKDFEDYLESLDIKNRSYNAISQVLTQIPQIKAHAEALGVDLMQITEDWLVGNMNPENGLWQDSVTRYSVNGMHKATRIFNSRRKAIPYAERGIKSTLDVIFSGEDVGGVVDIYNPWHVLSDMLTNIREFGDEETKKSAEALSLEVIRRAPEAIRMSADKLVDYGYEDGSYSYCKGHPSYTNQGMPSAVPGHAEGDANGNGCAVVGLVPSVFGALGLSDLFVPIFTGEDFEYYISLLEEKKAEYERKNGGA